MSLMELMGLMGLVQQYLKARHIIDAPLKDTPLKDTSRPSLMNNSYAQVLCTTLYTQEGLVCFPGFRTQGTDHGVHFFQHLV